ERTDHLLRKADRSCAPYRSSPGPLDGAPQVGLASVARLETGKNCAPQAVTGLGPRRPRRASKSERPMANVLTVVAKIRAAKGKGDALAALLKEQVAAVMKAEPGCLVYRPHRSTKDPDLFVFYEQYKDDAAFDAHRKAPHLAAYRERREKEGLTEGKAEVEIFRSLTD